MKKHLTRIICVVIVAAMLSSSIVMLAACNKNETTYDPESRPVTFAISALDGTFNPFFTTSATDSTIANFTQVGMLTTDNDGNPDCGENVPSVALDYQITYYDKNNNVIPGGDNTHHTTYEFVIKNGVKFSDGVPLTIDDVLFNLYVYLDPMYSGSSTIYSVDIQGLKAYRNNDASLNDEYEEDDAQYAAAAQVRIDNLLSWQEGDIEELTDEMRADIEKIKVQFRKDLNTDWTSSESSFSTDYKEHFFTEFWEAYYLMEGMLSNYTAQNPDNGNYYNVKTSYDDNGKYVYKELHKEDDYGNWAYDDESIYRTEMQSAISDEAKINQYISDNNCSREEAIELIKKDTAIEKAYQHYVGDDEGSIKNNLSSILQGTSTGANILADWTLEEKDKALENADENVLHISGITTRKATSFNGKKGNQLNGEHDVLSITINGIDPKAIYSFMFGVAPMHYYSSTEVLADKVNYPYGVKPRNKDFFDNVLNSPEKSALPVGAGAYRAGNEAGNASNDPSKISGKDFWVNKKVYFERNDYFETLGSGLSNAKIRRLTYIEISENNIINNLKTGELDYGTPSATPDNKAEIANESKLKTLEYKTSGYGYVGINPKYVKNIEVRRAIMKAFDVATIVEYYGETMVETINRPISKLSWAYPTSATPYYDYDNTGEVIEDMVYDEGYRINSDGIWEKDGDKLEFKFTIAGDTTDHPAYLMFEKAAQLLNKHGFKITVGTDIQALKKLATGKLAVWAAAWTSTIDPDMYQIYHKDSKATNVKNWNYEEILNPAYTIYYREREIVYELSEKIEEGRSTENIAQRTEIYAEALDLIMELAVEFPTYQRKDLYVYNNDVIDASTLNTSPDLKYTSPTDRIWELNYR